MITDLILNDEQKRSLERGITDAYAREGLETTGLEVLAVLKYETDYRVFYAYEGWWNSKTKEISTSEFFSFLLYSSHVEDVRFQD